MRRMTACICLSVILGSCVGHTNPPAGGSTGHDPYPYTTPTPPSESTSIDGIYARIVLVEVVGGAGACRRCPPYRLAAGEDILGLEKGVFEVYQRGTGYLSVGHYTTAGSTVTFFNDPSCPRREAPTGSNRLTRDGRFHWSKTRPRTTVSDLDS